MNINNNASDENNESVCVETVSSRSYIIILHNILYRYADIRGDITDV